MSHSIDLPVDHSEHRYDLVSVLQFFVMNSSLSLFYHAEVFALLSLSCTHWHTNKCVVQCLAQGFNDMCRECG